MAQERTLEIQPIMSERGQNGSVVVIGIGSSLDYDQTLLDAVERHVQAHAVHRYTRLVPGDRSGKGGVGSAFDSVAMGVGLAFHVRFLDRAFVQSPDVVFSSRNSCKLFLRKQKCVRGGARSRTRRAISNTRATCRSGQCPSPSGFTGVLQETISNTLNRTENEEEAKGWTCGLQ